MGSARCSNNGRILRTKLLTVIQPWLCKIQNEESAPSQFVTVTLNWIDHTSQEAEMKMNLLNSNEVMHSEKTFDCRSFIYIFKLALQLCNLFAASTHIQFKNKTTKRKWNLKGILISVLNAWNSQQFFCGWIVMPGVIEVFFLEIIKTIKTDGV